MSKYKNPVRKKEICAEVEGVGSLMTYGEHNSASRQVMATNQTGQSLVTTGNTKRRIIRGTEFEFGRFTFKQQFPTDAVVFAVIPKFPTNNVFQEDIGENPRTVIIYEASDDNGDPYIDILDVSVFHKSHPNYGFRYKFDDDVVSSLTPGQAFHKGTVIADSPNVADDGDYMYGFDVNVAMMSHPAGIEDGFMISEDLHRQLEVNAYGHRNISVGKNNYLLNIYGDDELYKPFPSIGESIRDDRLLFSSREFNESMAIVDMMPARKGRVAASQKPNFMFDDCIYTEKPGRVIDITVYKNHARKSNLPSKTTTWLDKWYQLNYNFYNSIIRKHEELKTRFPNGFTTSYAFETLLVEAMGFCVSPRRSDQLVRTMNGQPLDEYSVHITYEYKYTPIIGGKFTGGAGDKGVAVRITPTEDMPRDAEGNIAHIVVDDFSTIKRMNLGRTYEQEIGASCLAVEKRVKTLVETKGYKEAWSYLAGFYQLAAPEMWKIIVEAGIDKSPKKHIDHVLSDKIYLWAPSHQEKENQQIVEDLKNHYPPCKGPVTYRDLAGNVVTTRSPVLIGPMYFMLLEKTASHITGATASTRYQHHGILATVQGGDRNKMPVKNNPTRAGGESEVRLHQSVMDGEAVAEQLEQTNDPSAHKAIVRKIHATTKPSDIPQVIDRDEIPRGNSRPLKIVNHKMQCFGIKLVHEQEKK